MEYVDLEELLPSTTQINLSNIHKLESKYEKAYVSDLKEGPWLNIVKN